MKTMQKEGLSGVLFIAVGGTFALVSLLHHPLGTLVSMGRGFFPLVVGLALMLVGALLLWQQFTGFQTEEEAFSLDLKPLVLIAGAVVLFGVLLPVAGLYLTILATVLLSARADRNLRIMHALALGIGLAVAAHLAFVAGLGLHIPLTPAGIRF